MRTGSGQRLWKRAKGVIPGGGQLLSKRAEMFLPEQWPSYYSKVKGCEVWDLDGKRYIDMSLMGVGSCILGYADKEVNQAVKEAVDKGSMSTLNAPAEVELAELLCRIHPWADMARFARTGGEAMAAAVRIARAHSDRDVVAFCGYHGWADWYLAANLASRKTLDGHLLKGLEPNGVPRALRGTILPFRYNHIEELEAHVKKHGKKIGVIVMEPIRGEEPKGDFLKKVRRIADSLGAVLVFDEITVGWKLCWGGAHLKYGVNPDIAVFSKAMSNGYAMAAIIGRKEVMQAAQGSFISSTYWTEGIGPAAALETIRKMKQVGAVKRLQAVGLKVRAAWSATAKKHSIPIKISGIIPISSFSFEHKDAAALKTLFTQEMLERGYLASTTLYASCAHTEAHIRKYLKSVDDVFRILAEAIRMKTIHKRLKGPVAHSGFQRLN